MPDLAVQHTARLDPIRDELLELAILVLELLDPPQLDDAKPASSQCNVRPCETRYSTTDPHAG